MSGIQENQKSESVLNAKVHTGIKKRNSGWDNVIQKPLLERFWLNVDKKSPDECWNWIGAKNRYGYGKIRNCYKMIGSHRISYILHYGPIPDGLHVLHKCDNRKCVNPYHLFLGTQSDNNKDMFKKGRNVSNPRFGKTNNMSKLTDIKVIEIRNLYKKMKVKDIAKKFGIARQTVRLIATNKAWRHI